MLKLSDLEMTCPLDANVKHKARIEIKVLLITSNVVHFIKRNAEVRRLRLQQASWRAGQFPSLHEAKPCC